MLELRPETKERLVRALSALPSLTEDVMTGDIRYYNPNGKHELGASKRKVVDELEGHNQKVLAVLRGPNSETHYLILEPLDLSIGRVKTGADSVLLRSFCNGTYVDVKVSEIDGILAIL